jgi:type II secretory pathway component GspD/PulD (secretin)
MGSLLMVGCATEPVPIQVETPETLDNLVEMQLSKPSQPLKSQRPEELSLTQPELVLKKPVDKGPRLTLAVKDRDLKTILVAIGKKIDQNIIVDPGINEKVTVDLKNVTLTEALDSLLQPVHLKYEIEDGFIRVSPLTMESRIFQMNYIISRRQGRGHIATARQSAEASLKDRADGTFSSKVWTSEETDLWREIESGLKKIVSRPESIEKVQAASLPTGNPRADHSAYFSINKQSGIIMVRDFSDNLNRVGAFLEAIEGSVQRQVLIQAKVIEVVLNKQYHRGIDWTEVTPMGILPPINDAQENADADNNPGFTFGMRTTRHDTLLEILSRQGDVSVLSSPRIVTLNNQRAVIKIGTEDTVFTAAANNGESSGERFIAEPLTIGLVLDVLPQINVNGKIMMSVNTSLSEKIGERTSPDGKSVVPVLKLRQYNNVILSENGQTIVVGGLMKTQRKVDKDPVPGLGYLPVVGEVFQIDELNEEKTEVVILLTPEVMTGTAIQDRYKIEENRLLHLGDSGVWGADSFSKQ